MHLNVVVLFGIFALTASASLRQSDRILVQTNQNKILVANQNGKQVIIATSQQGAFKEVNGPQTIEVEISGPGRIPKIVEIPDKQVSTDGTSQSDILQQIFQQNNGVQNASTFQAILDRIAANVAKGKVNPVVLAALETVSASNQQDDTAVNQILKQTEQKQLEKQALKDTMQQQAYGRLGSPGNQVVIEAGLDEILIVNGEGQQLEISTRQQSRIGGPQAIQIQISGPGIMSRAVKVIDEQAQNGASQSEILQQIARQARGVQDVQSYQYFLREIAANVAAGQLSPAVLAAVEAVAPQNHNNPTSVNRFPEDAQQTSHNQRNAARYLPGSGPLSQWRNIQSEKIMIEERPEQIVVANQNGQQVTIKAGQQAGINGQQVIQIQISGPGIAPKSIQVRDQQQAQHGASQSQILQQIARQARGVQDVQSYQYFLKEIAANVAAGQLSPAVLAAVEAVAPQNQNNPTSVNRFLEQAQQTSHTQRNAARDLPGFGPLSQWRNMQSEKIMIEERPEEIVVANENGQRVTIKAGQQAGINGQQVIQIQISGPGIAPKSIQVRNQQVAPGITQGDILKQIIRQNNGLNDLPSYQILLQRLAKKVAQNEINPAILAALEAVYPQNQAQQQQNAFQQQIQFEQQIQRQPIQFGRGAGIVAQEQNAFQGVYGIQQRLGWQRNHYSQLPERRGKWIQYADL